MRHRMGYRKLGRTTEHRISMLRNLAVSLIDHERIRTTLAKAKELRPFAERLVTLGKKDTLHARRRALSLIPHRSAVQKLFGEISPRFAERPGGYTRILKLGPRRGDGADMAFIEFVDYQFTPEGQGKPGAPKAAEKKRPAKEEKAEAAPEAKPERKTRSKRSAEKKADEKEGSAKKSAKSTSAAKKTATAKKKTAGRKTSSRKRSD